MKQDKYYVGKSNNIDFRIEDHFDSSGSSWTKKYKPIEVMEILPNCDDYDEGIGWNRKCSWRKFL